jgi:hypothetical protein
VGDYFRRYPHLSSVYCYSSDYPHVEGGKYAKQIFSDKLEGLPDEIYENFFVRNGELLFPEP